MLPKTRLLLAASLLALPLSLSVSRADVAPIQLLTSQVISDPSAQTVTFSLTFDRAPALQLYNSYGNAADELKLRNTRRFFALIGQRDLQAFVQER